MANQQVMELLIRANADFSQTQKEVQNLQGYLNKLNLPANLRGKFTELFAGFESEAKKYQKFLDSGFKTKGDVTGLEKSGTQISRILSNIKKELSGISPDMMAQIFKGVDLVGLQNAEEKVKTLKQELQAMYQTVGSNGKTLATNFAEAEAALKNIGKSAAADQVRKAFAGGNLAEMNQAVNVLQQQAEHYRTTRGNAVSYAESVDTLIQFLGQLNSTPGLTQKQEELNQAQATLQRLNETNMTQLSTGLTNAADRMGELSARTRQTNVDLNGAATAMFNFNNEVGMLKNRIAYFFGLTNGVMLFRRALMTAFRTVKELDAAMTTTAVVTNFTIGDMWDQLPQYTKKANELGVTIKGVYEASALYYQQGLDTKQVMEVSTETLKMAKIAGLEYADATDFMTAALRGFNMEVNETNAQRVNDVYSKLAANTASNVQEIATAMTKTASLANNANMEFETTAAFLSQIIETTRESAETAGTALKTVIARFQELKKDPSEIGEVDGEVIDANKIEGALRTIGVALRDETGQFRDLDDVFLDIAKKWDGLDTNTQRYIATIAAGSRQQSRFIAMMSNYGRTVELVEMANGAAGASQQQFEKTLESMASLLDQLKNSWNEYLMGITNSDVIKGFITVLTELIDGINKITSGFGDFGGVIAKIGVALLAFKGARFALSLFDPKMMAKEGEKAGALAGTHFYKSFQNKRAAYGTLRAEGASKGSALMGATFKKGNFLEVGKEYSVKQLQAAGVSDRLIQEHIPPQKVLVPPQPTGILGPDGKPYMTSETYKEVEQNLNDYEGKIKATAQMNQQLSEQMRTNWAAIGGAIMGAAMLVSMLSKAFGDLDQKTQGVVDGAVNGLMTAGLAMMTLTKLADVLFKTVSAGASTALGIIGIALGIIVAAFQIVDALTETAEERAERLKEETAAMAAAAKEAKQAYEDLKDSLSDYGKLIDSFSKLREGTDEWRDALIKANEQVVELLKTYPELAKYLERKDGILVLNEEGQEQAIKIAQERAISATASSAALYAYQASESNAGEKTRETYYDDLSNTEMITPSLDFDEIYKAISNNDSIVIGDDTIDLAEMLLNPEKLYNYTMTASDENVKELTKYMDKRFGIYASNARNYDSAEEFTKIWSIPEAYAFYSTQQAAIEGEVSGYLSTGLQGVIDPKILDKEISGPITDLVLENFSSQEYRAAFEAKRDELSNDQKELEEQYKKVFNTSVIPENILETGAEGLKDAIAGRLVFKDLSAGVEGFYKTVSKKTKEQQNNFLGLVTEGGKKITLAQRDSFKNDMKDANVPEITEGVFKSVTGLDAETVAKELGFVDSNGKPLTDKFLEYVNSNVDDADTFFTNAISKLANVSNSNFTNTLKGLDVDATAWNDFIVNFRKIEQISGKDSANAAAGVIDGFLQGIEDTDLRAYAAEMLSIVDLTDADEIRNYSEAISEQMFAMGYSKEQVDAFEEALIDAAKAARDFSLDTFKEEISSLGDLEDKIREKIESGDKTFDIDEVYELVAKGASADLFVQTESNEWTYIGDMVTLLDIIKQHTGNILDEMPGSLKNKVNEGREVSSAVQADKKVNIYRQGEDPLPYGAAEFLNAIASGEINIIKDSEKANALGDEGIGGAVGSTGVYSLTSLFPDINWEGMTAEEIITKVQTLLTNYIDLPTNEAALETTGKIIDPYHDKSESELSKMATAGDEQAQSSLDKRLQATAGAQSIYNELLKETNDLNTENINNLKAQAIATQKAKQSVERLNGVIEDNKDVLKDFDSETASTEDWGKIQAIAESAKEIFGESVDADFVAQNADLFAKLAKGGKEGQEAYDAIIRKIKESQIAAEMAKRGIEGDANYITRVLTAIDGIKIEVDSTADFSEIEKAAAEAKVDVKDLVGYLGSLDGWKVELISNEDFLKDLSSTLSPTELFRKMGEYKQTPLGFLKVTKTGDGAGDDDDRDAVGSYKPKEDEGGGDDKFENDLDKQFNLLRKIEKLERGRAKAADDYADALERGTMSGLELAELTQKEMDYLFDMKDAQEELRTEREKEIQDLINSNSQYSEYAWWDEELGVQIDWDKINKIEDAEVGEGVTNYVSELEELSEGLVDIDDSLEDIDDQIYELSQRGRDEYLSLTEQVREGLVEQEQAIIDANQKIADAIDDANSDLLDAIQSSVDKMRQDRENEKTEEELADKERRLAYLQQDTSGANALEIAQLEKEIQEGREGYTDNLIDQAINNLQEQNEEAAEQRNRQIQLAESQLQFAQDNGLFNARIESILAEGLATGKLEEGTELYKILYKINEAASMTEEEKKKLYQEKNAEVGAATVYNTNKGTTPSRSSPPSGSNGNGNGNGIGDGGGDEGNPWVGVAKTMTNFGDLSNAEIRNNPTLFGQMQTAASSVGYTITGPNDIEGTLAFVTAYQNEIGYSDTGKKTDGINGKVTNDKGLEYLEENGFRTGGYTGEWGREGRLAFLHEKELVLNKSDTERMLEMVRMAREMANGSMLDSILSSTLKLIEPGASARSLTSAAKGGDNYFDIDIHVDEIASDYDVDMIADRIKSNIYEDAMYRNVNAINFLR